MIRKPIIFAHRGACAHAPENTLAAFELGLQHGADGIELDTKLCADGHVVVIHDQTVDRTTQGTGKVSQMPLASLKELDAGSYFSCTYQGEPIPTLDEVFETIGQHTLVNIELTNYATPGDTLPEKVAELVKKHNLDENVLFSSFNPQALRQAHKCLPKVPLGLLTLPGPPGWVMRSWLGRMLVPYQALHPEKQDVNTHLVRQAHQHGHRVHVWTVNDAEEMQKLFTIEVDGIITDDPRLARQVLQSIK